MRRHQASIDRCKQAALKHRAGLSGTVLLALKVADHHVTVTSIAGDTIKDARLDACLVSASRQWTFDVPHAEFRWQVDVGPKH
jgi:hypothetical protein